MKKRFCALLLVLCLALGLLGEEELDELLEPERMV